ncbi:MAG: hypothetical protein WA705_23680 [Candidatus Ozemobacteraceae bacterium]
MRKTIARILPAAALLIGMVAAGFPVAAVTPDIRLPSWHELEPRVLSWDGKGDLIVEVEMRALKVPLHDLSAKIGWPRSIEGTMKRAHADILEPGKSWKSSHLAHAPRAFDGWIELEASARPDSAGLEGEIKRVATYTEMARNILVTEAKSFKTPIPLGRSVPLHIDESIAALLPRELLFVPLRPVGVHAYYFWAPAGVLGTGTVAEVFMAFGTAIRGQEDSAALAAVETLEKAVAESVSGDGMMPFKSFDGGETRFSQKIILEALAANRATLELLCSRKDAAKKLADRVQNGKNRMSTPFLAVNLGVYYKAQGRGEDAAVLWRQALSLNPGWPLVRAWLNPLKGGKK